MDDGSTSITGRYLIAGSASAALLERNGTLAPISQPRPQARPDRPSTGASTYTLSDTSSFATFGMSPVSRAKLSPSCQTSNWPVTPQASRARQLSNVGVIVCSQSTRPSASPTLATPDAKERDSGERTMGVGLTHSTSAEKKCGCRTYTPPAGEERDSDERTMGVGLTASSPLHLAMAVKNFGSRTYPQPSPLPPPARIVPSA